LAVTGRRVAEVAGCAAVAALLAVWIGPSLPGVGGHRPYDPHTPEIPLSQSATELLNPLANLSAWAASPNQVLFNLRVSRPVDLRLAVLDTYDPGIGWGLSPANRFRLAGKDLAGASGGHGKVTVAQQVTIEDVSGRWLPSADRPVQVTGIGALVEPHTGVLLSRVPAASGTRYQVRSVVPASPPSCRLSAVGRTSGPAVTIPTELSNLAQSLTTGTTAPCARAQALATGLRDAYKFDAKAPSGSNIQILRNFLIGSADNKGGQGTSEQFASAFALLGRALSLPTRVVVGFHAASSGPLKAGDAQAWPEVNFAGVGWVAFDPTPAANQTSHPDKPIEGSTSGSSAKVNPSGTGPQPVEATPRLPPLRRHHQAGPWSTLGLIVATVVGAALLLLLILVSVIALVRQRRRLSRQRAADNRGRVLGAWKESLDNLSDAGVAAEPAFTASQVVQAGASRLSGSAQRDLADLGSLVNAAIYGPVPPDDATVDRAWAEADRLAEAARADLTAKDRLRRAVDVTVFARSR
jgi:transglutaminase-like putative cysteine protease